jgi:hypothetical protein
MVRKEVQDPGVEEEAEEATAYGRLQVKDQLCRGMVELDDDGKRRVSFFPAG